jgi:hypothetical protein
MLCLGITALVLGPWAAILSAQASASVPRITFTKTLKGSSPEYMALSVDANGKGTYDAHKLDDPSAPRPLLLSADTVMRIFSLARDLDNFQSLDLDSRHKVANMGLKTLTYEAGKESYRVQYNYTENRTAQQLTELFEKIGSVEEHISQLEYEMRYDHLNLPQTLSEIQEEMAGHNLAECALLVPTLEKIEGNPRFMHLAKARAQEIMRDIQAQK